MQSDHKHRAPHAFLLALAGAFLMFLPFLIYDKGYFIYYGDFNVQQIPFYKLAHEAVRSGDIFWNWHTDLGANFIGSYSFYLLFSPFFWLTLPFPTALLPKLMAPLLMLKTACASATACMYLNRFVRDARWAVLGGLLYAFSGWMDFNIFFNHFHEAAVFFPLLLLSLEMLVQEDRKGLFAFAVAVNAMVNYWFFIGEAVFVVLYVIIRRTDKSWRLTLKKFCLIAWEAVIGAGLAMLALLPSVLALMGNWRTGTSELLSGWNLWLYWHEQRQPAIIQSLFFPPEIPAYPNFFPDHGAKWASLSGWLPLVAMTGVLAYFFQRRNDWLKKILALCLAFALVPALNSLFVLLNDSYYARWFYMPVLLMALASIRALEDAQKDLSPFLRAFGWSIFVLITITVVCGLTPNLGSDDVWQFGLSDKPLMLWTYSAIAMTFLLATSVIVVRYRNSRRFLPILLTGVLVSAVGFNIYYIANGKYNRERGQWLIDHAINGREQISLPETPFARIDIYDSTDNIGMYWRQPTIQAFHSIVPPSIMNFYPKVGVTRDVGSRPEPAYYALRPLLSVRWLFLEDKGDGEDPPMPGYTYYDIQNGFRVYQNEYWLPMGFSYDTFATLLDLEDVREEHRGNFLLKTVVLEENAIERNQDLLQPAEDDDFLDLSQESVMAQDVERRRRYTADSFVPDSRGFTATTSFDSERFLFFSVPWEQGWSAEMRTDGGSWQPLRIERASIGFMAVRVPAGNVTIRFHYLTPGLIPGLVVSAGFLFLFAGYLLVCRRVSPIREDFAAQRTALSGYAARLSWDEYMAAYGDREARAAYLRQVLTEAAALQSESSDGSAPPPPPPLDNRAASGHTSMDDRDGK